MEIEAVMLRSYSSGVALTLLFMGSGAGTNLKVGGGDTGPAESVGKIFFGRAPPL